ncbi:ribonuclease H-like domain-containing protein, partial [Tanacetum coccineum]
MCRFGDGCRFVHDANVKNNSNSGVETKSSNTYDLLIKLLGRLEISFHSSQMEAQIRPPAVTLGSVGPTVSQGQATTFPHAFTAKTLHDPASGAWNIDTGVSSHLNDYVTNLSKVFNSCMYPSVSVGDGHSIPVTNTGHSILPTSVRPLHLNNVLITPHIVKNLIYVRQFVCDNNCMIEFDAFGFSVKDFMSRRVLLRCDSTGDLYPVTHPSPIPRAFLVSQHT